MKRKIFYFLESTLFFFNSNTNSPITNRENTIFFKLKDSFAFENLLYSVILIENDWNKETSKKNSSHSIFKNLGERDRNDNKFFSNVRWGPQQRLKITN